jgi:hypothetical protein
MTVAYAGYSSIKRNYFGRFPFSGTAPQPEFRGRLPYRRVPPLLDRDCDLLFAEVGTLTTRYFQGAGGTIIPEWTPMRIDITRPMEELRRRGVSDFANVERYIRKYGLTCRLTADRRELEQFYGKMYLPYLAARHGDEALMETMPELLDHKADLVLLLVLEEGEPISGVLMERCDGYLNMFRLGIARGDASLISHGAIGALYYFAVIEGQQTGCRYLDVGGTRPFLTDGITQSKLRHSARFSPHYSAFSENLWFGHAPTPPAEAFVENNPYLYWSSDFRLLRSDAPEDGKFPE